MLNGDWLAEKFPLDGEIVICREALIDGPVSEKSEELFWQQRAQYISEGYHSTPTEYYRLVVDEFNKLRLTGLNAINLWFEHDLFCQANLWFTINFISKHVPSKEVFLVMPTPADDYDWAGFGRMDKALMLKCYENKALLNASDKQIALSLWNAYSSHDTDALANLAATQSTCFPKLREVCEAHLDRVSPFKEGRPQRRLRSIIKSGEKNFQAIFEEFKKTEGVYGFSDLQVKRMLTELSL